MADANVFIRRQLLGNVVINPYNQALGVTLNCGGVCSNNIVVARSTPVYMTGSSNGLFQFNTLYNTDTHGTGGASGYSLMYSGGTNGWQYDFNQYFTPAKNLAVGNEILFIGAHRKFTLSQWQESYGFDRHSTINYTNPPDSVRVWPNRYQAKRCNLAVCNWSLQDNVAVRLAGVLTAGDHYQLYNAQNFLAGPIISGNYNGTDIKVPMTNLTTAPILFGGNANAWGDTFTQPPPISPMYGAFVVVGTAP